jgi:hypothetical protein
LVKVQQPAGHILLVQGHVNVHKDVNPTGLANIHEQFGEVKLVGQPFLPVDDGPKAVLLNSAQQLGAFPSVQILHIHAALVEGLQLVDCPGTRWLWVFEEICKKD